MAMVVVAMPRDKDGEVAVAPTRSLLPPQGSRRSLISPSELKKLSTHERAGGGDASVDVGSGIDEKAGEGTEEEADEHSCGETGDSRKVEGGRAP